MVPPFLKVVGIGAVPVVPIEVRDPLSELLFDSFAFEKVISASSVLRFFLGFSLVDGFSRDEAGILLLGAVVNFEHNSRISLLNSHFLSACICAELVTCCINMDCT